MPTTAEDLLRCDHCRRPIEDLDYGMLFWDPEARSDGAVDLSLFLAHKGCHAKACPGLGGDSAELSWFADSDQSLRRLADMTVSYSWNAAELERLVLVAWAVPLVASEKDRRLAARAAEFF